MQVTKDQPDAPSLLGALGGLAFVIVLWGAIIFVAVRWVLPPLFNNIYAFNGWKARECLERGGTVTEGPLFGVYCVGPKR